MSSECSASVLVDVLPELKNLVLFCEVLCIELLDRRVRGQQALAHRLRQDSIPLQVLDGGAEALRQPVGSNGLSLFLRERVRVHHDGRGQIEPTFDAIQAGRNEPAKGYVWICARVR